MKTYGYKWIILVLSVIMSVIFIGCGYSEEEKAQMQEYVNQASENAVNYISEKYGFQANLLEADCETAEVIGVPDFSPSATGDVLVHMEYDEYEFLVMISGKEPTTEGSDNYQFKQIQQAIAEEINALTGFFMKEMKVVYGNDYQIGMDLDDSGLVHAYYDGTNLAKVLSENDCQMVCSYVDADLSTIDTEAIKNMMGDAEVLFVSYRSEDDFKNAGNRNFNLGGTPLDYGIENKAFYINEYRMIDGNDEEYVQYDLREQNGIYYIPEDKDAQVVLTETVLDDASNWNGNGFSNAKQVLDTAYAIDSESDVIYVFIPVDMLENNECADSVGMIVYQYEDEESIEYSHAVTFLSDDRRYLVGTIYTRDYLELKMSVLRNIDVEKQ